MSKKILLLFLISGIISACSSSNDAERIDYSNLETLQTKVTLEITESEEFLPGNLKDIIVDSDGNILVSDWGDISISQFDSEGNFVSKITEGGNGPGEISKYFAIRNVGFDTLMVQEPRSGREYFAKDTNGEYEFVRSINPDRMEIMNIETVGHKTDSTYYSKITSLYPNIQQAAKNEGEYRNAILAETSLSGEIVQDSLLLLKKGTRHVLETSNGYSMLQVPYLFDDHLVLLNEGFLVARPDSNAIFVYDNNAELQQRIPFNVSPRPITEEDLDIALNYLPDNLSGDNVRELKTRIGETKPPYMDVWISDQIIWLQTSNNHKENKELVLLNFDGEPIGKMTLENTKNIGAVQRNYIYTIHEDVEQGNTIRKYEVQI